MKDSTNQVLITGTFSIISAIIGAFLGAKFESNHLNVTIDNYPKNISSQEEYEKLELQYENQINENIDLKAKINSLNDELSKIVSLSDEYELLKQENEKLKSQINSLGDNTPVLETNNNSEAKISIFDLDTFKGTPYWSDRSYYDSICYIDTYDNDYLTAYIGHHRSATRNSEDAFTYLLDKKYSICEGEIAWSKADKNSEEKAWIEFYSGDELLYKTDVITSDSRVLSFQFSVDDVEKLTIVRNGTCNQYNSVMIIYPYLNLIKKVD